MSGKWIITDNSLTLIDLFSSFFSIIPSKGRQISVVFGAKNLKNYHGERFNKVSVHKKEFDR